MDLVNLTLEGGALIVGASGHLMSAVAKRVAQAGSFVVCADLNPDLSRSICDEIIASGGNAAAIPIDVTDESSIKEAIYMAKSITGGLRYLVNGAGLNAPTPLEQIEKKEWLAILDVQLIGVFFTCKEFFLNASEHSSIVNISSASANPPLSKAFVYSAAKAALANLTKNLAREWADVNVRVNAIRPGFFPNQWARDNFIDAKREGDILRHTPMKRFGDPEEITSAVVWLLSEESSFVTGSELYVDGGFSAMTI
jgi:NAD(P)-dependent dehydrogenase (short-subunit alcohol dehydrogenase family)